MQLRSLLIVLVLVARASGDYDYEEDDDSTATLSRATRRDERLGRTAEEVMELLNSPWIPIDLVSEAFKTGLIRNIEKDVELAHASAP